MSNDNHDPQSGLSYRDAGVDIDAGNELVERIKPAVARTMRPEVLTGLGGFGALFRLDLARWKEPLLVSGTDGVGTKLMLARQMERHDTIGIDLVAMCVNDILTSGAEPLFFLDYFATGHLQIDEAQAVIEGIAEGCRRAGCALIGGETAEMPGMYGAGEYDLAGFAVGAVERSQVLDGSRIRAGHRLLGLESSGPHSNGYSLIRKVLERAGADPGQPLAGSEEPKATRRPRLGESSAASGTRGVELDPRRRAQPPFAQRAGAAKRDSDLPLTLGDALLAPTRIYTREVRQLLAGGGIDGLAHITGGGLTENIVRSVPNGLGIEIDAAAWTRPAVFDWLQESGNIDAAEMLRTFNCGIGMVVLAPAAAAADIRARCGDMGVACHDIGEVVPHGGDDMRVRYLR